eukprot:90900-Chlamydomonas_euryale.AAC.1
MDQPRRGAAAVAAAAVAKTSHTLQAASQASLVAAVHVQQHAQHAVGDRPVDLAAATVVVARGRGDGGACWL